jgi:hypothetical protein
MSDRLSGALSPDIAPLERVNISRRAYATTHIVVVRYARELVATQLQVLRCGAGLRRPGILRALSSERQTLCKVPYGSFAN